MLRKILYLNQLMLVALLSAGVSASWAGEVATKRQEILMGRQALTQATILQKSGNSKDAINVLHSQFPDGPLSGELAVGYYRIIGNDPNGKLEARSGFEALVKNDPKNLEYHLAYLTFLMKDQTEIPQALENYYILTKRFHKDSDRIFQSWSMALNSLKEEEYLIPFYQDYLERDPRNEQIYRHLQNAFVLEANRKRIEADPLLSKRQLGLNLVDKGDYVAAKAPISQVLKQMPNDPQVQGAMGLILMKEGQNAQASSYFERARDLDPNSADRWGAMLEASQYWKLLNESRDARGRKNYRLAESKAQAAIQLDPKQAEGFAVLGSVLEESGNFANAEKNYKKALTLEPNNGTAMSGLVGLYIIQNRGNEAWAMLNARAPNDKTYDYLKVRLLSASADEFIQQGRNNQAEKVLKKALDLQPADPWVRLKLASLYLELDSPGAGFELMQDGMKRAPRNAAMIKAFSMYLLDAGKNDEALTLVSNAVSSQKFPSVDLLISYASLLNRFQKEQELDLTLAQLKKLPMTSDAKQQVLSIQLSYEIRQALASGDHSKALPLIKQALSLDEDDIWLLLDMARIYSLSGTPQEGAALFDSYLKTHPNNVDGLYAYSVYLSGLNQSQKALKTLEKIPDKDRTAKVIAYQRKLWVDLQIQKAIAFNVNGKKAKAEALLEKTQAKSSPDPDLLSSVAFGWLRIGDEDAAAKLFQKTLISQKAPSVSLQLSYSNFLLQTNRIPELNIELEKLSSKKMNIEDAKDYANLQKSVQLKAIGNLIQEGEVADAKEKLQPLFFASPEDARLFDLKSQIERKEGFLDHAIASEQYALANEGTPLSSFGSLSRLQPRLASNQSGVPVFTIEAPKAQPSAVNSGDSFQYQQIAEMLDKRTNSLAGAYDLFWHSGTAGQSTYIGSEIPLEWKIPIRSDERVTLRADQVIINGGSLDLSNTYATSTFGSMLLCQPNCSSSLLNQSAMGTAVNGAYEKENFKMDVGSTPIGFLVQNWVGGIKQKGDVGPVGFTVEAFRRPMTASLLSYAGTKDPRTGETWGGVVGTGGSLGASIDKGETFGVWSTLRARSLTGTNVQSNSDRQFMLGLNYRMINETDRRLSSGLSGMLWAFRRDAGEFTYGQGGYYSPQNYRSVSLPLYFAQRTARLSFLVGGSVSANRSTIDSSPYYPTNSQYQSAAGNPYYSASSGPGTAWSALGNVEYQLSPSTIIGSRLQVERSPFYAPNRFIVYLRFALDGASPQVVSLQPEPVIPTSRF